MEPEQPADPTWKAAAERARAMSEQWRSLHEAEEARANEARAYAARAGAAAKRAEAHGPASGLMATQWTLGCPRESRGHGCAGIWCLWIFPGKGC